MNLTIHLCQGMMHNSSAEDWWSARQAGHTTRYQDPSHCI